MKFKFKKSTKPAEVPRLGWTLFIAVVAAQGFIGAFDSAPSVTFSDKIGSAAVGVGFSIWAILRALEMKKYQYKLRSRPRLGITIFIGIVGLFSIGDLFNSAVSISNTQTVADRLLGLFVGIWFTLWAVLRHVFGREFEENEK
jgi:membrane associated rhomboid family serine protease